MKQEKPITITEQGFNKLFCIHENIDNLERIVSKCDAVTDILEEALESMNDKGIRPSDDTTIVDVVSVIHDYSCRAKNHVRDVEDDLSTFYNNLCSKYVVNGGECCEWVTDIH